MAALRPDPKPAPEPRSKSQTEKEIKVETGGRSAIAEQRDPASKQNPGKRVADTILPIEQISLAHNSRDKEDAINLIAASFRAEGGETDGQIHSIGVIQDGTDPDHYVVIHGHQRLGAAKKLKWETIKATIWELGDRDPAFKQLAENQKRSQISMVEEGAVFQRLIENAGMNQVEIAREYGCRREHVNRCLRLVNSSDQKVQTLVRDGKLSGHKALAISQLPLEEQGKLAQSATSQEWSLAKIEREIKSIKLQRKTLSEKMTKEPTELIIPAAIEMQHVVLPDDLDALDIQRLAAYIILRNGNDQAVLEYLEDRGITWDNLWAYVRDQTEAEIAATLNSLVRRYIQAPHRYTSIEPGLLASLGATPSKAVYPAEQEQPIALPVDAVTIAPDPISKFSEPAPIKTKAKALPKAKTPAKKTGGKKSGHKPVRRSDQAPKISRPGSGPRAGAKAVKRRKPGAAK